MKKHLLALLVFVAIIIGAGYWFMMYPKSPESITADSTTPTSDSVAASATKEPVTTASATTPPKKNTLRSVLTQSGNHECKYETLDGSTKQSSVIYLSDGKMRAEFRTTGDVGDLMIYDGVNLYSWQEGKTIGTRTKISTIAQLPDAIPKDLTSGAIIGRATDNASWDCHQWLKDPKLFVIPSYVSFK